MDRSTRRHHARRVRARLLRLHYDVAPACLQDLRGELRPVHEILKYSPCWLGGEPKWWQKLHNLRPSRHRQNRILHAIRRGLDPDAVGRWPDYRKPHIYYW